MQRQDRRAFAILLFFAALHALIFVPNHWLFRTYALDLGLYTNALWDYAHFRANDSTLFLDHPQNLLADHFDLHLMLWSPLIWLSGTWTLLIVQWVALLAGAMGVRRLLIAQGASTLLADLALAHFLLFFGLFAAISYDYHSNVVAAMALPWYLLAVHQGRWGRSTGLLLFMLAAKENMGLWLAMVALGAMLLHRRERLHWRVLLAHACVALGWSVLTIGVIMPALASEGTYAHFDYRILGQAPGEALVTLATEPLKVIGALFTDHAGVRDGQAIKVEFFMFLILSGGIALVLDPRYGLMAVPLLMQKLLHDDPGKWGVLAQYSAEFAPIVTLSLFGLVQRIRNEQWPSRIGLLAVFVSVGLAVRFMDHTVAYQDRSRIRFYQAQHYQRVYDARSARKAIRELPSDAPISAQSPMVPHLALRDRIYQYPIVGDARFIALMIGESPYPLHQRHYTAALDTLRGSAHWRLIVGTDGLLIFERGGTGQLR